MKLLRWAPAAAILPRGASGDDTSLHAQRTRGNLFEHRRPLLAGAYASWQWYDRDKLASPANLPLDKYDRVNFAFFQPDADGHVFGTDSWADPNILFGGYDFGNAALPIECRNVTGWDADTPCDVVERCHRNFPRSKICNNHKHKEGLIYRAHAAGAEVFATIGGWTLSGSFPEVAAAGEKRERFAEECVGLIEDYGFDGVSIDWEYPGYEPHGGSARDKENFSKLLLAVREALNDYQARTGAMPLGEGAFRLAATLPCDPARINFLDVSMVNKIVDRMDLLTFDFNNEKGEVTGANSPLYDQEWDKEAGWSVDGCVKNYLAAGADWDKGKMSIGIPFYGKSFAYATELNVTHSGSVDQHGWPRDIGTPVYYNIVDKLSEGGMVSHWHEPTKTQYAYFKDGSGMVSYDDPQAVCNKVEYVQENELGGLHVWEMSGDLMTNLETPLIDAIRNKLDDPSHQCNLTASATSLPSLAPSLAVAKGVDVHFPSKQPSKAAAILMGKEKTLYSNPNFYSFSVGEQPDGNGALPEATGVVGLLFNLRSRRAQNIYITGFEFYTSNAGSVFYGLWSRKRGYYSEIGTGGERSVAKLSTFNRISSGMADGTGECAQNLERDSSLESSRVDEGAIEQVCPLTVIPRADFGVESSALLEANSTRAFYITLVSEHLLVSPSSPSQVPFGTAVVVSTPDLELYEGLAARTYPFHHELGVYYHTEPMGFIGKILYRVEAADEEVTARYPTAEPSTQSPLGATQIGPNNFCGTCMWKPDITCEARLAFVVNNYQLTNEQAVTSLLEQGKCIATVDEAMPPGGFDGGKETTNSTSTASPTMGEPSTLPPHAMQFGPNAFCGTCMWNPEFTCEARLAFVVNNYQVSNEQAVTSLLEQGKCIATIDEVMPPGGFGEVEEPAHANSTTTASPTMSVSPTTGVSAPPSTSAPAVAHVNLTTGSTNPTSVPTAISTTEEPMKPLTQVQMNSGSPSAETILLNVTTATPSMSVSPVTTSPTTIKPASDEPTVLPTSLDYAPAPRDESDDLDEVDTALSSATLDHAIVSFVFTLMIGETLFLLIM